MFVKKRIQDKLQIADEEFAKVCVRHTVCVSVRACVRACVRAFVCVVCACVHACTCMCLCVRVGVSL